ncbi:LPXTG cell wall anchor domain-containing protein [Apilactobacillus kunkeei]|nr:LPXTG cell wall anchor domain-containing protein [Apilactobacillus kunkeei]
MKNISIPNIESIDVSHNQISDFTPVVNKQWNNLTDLNAGFNHIEDISPIAKVNWTNLQNLNVENNNISDISVITSANWPNLLKLDADNNNITDINAFADTNWTKLKVISAAGNHISNVSALKGKSVKFPNLSTFIVNNNNINDISWMDGFKFNSNSTANQQIINSTVNVVKQADGKNVFIKLPITISDVNLDNDLKASADSKGENLQVNNDYLNNNDGNSFNQNGTIIDPSNVIGSDGKANSSVKDDNGNYKSNGISGVNILSGNGSQKYTFGFTSTLGINQNGYFNGAYNLNVNWGKNVTQEKTVKVTVNYIGDDGKTLDTKSKSVKFTETGFKPDDSSKQTAWNNDWTTSDDTKFSFDSGQYDGYQNPSQANVSGNLTADSNDLVETVSYKAIKSTSSSEANSSSAQSPASSSVTTGSSAQSSASSSEANSSSAQSFASSSEAISSSAQSSAVNNNGNNAGNPNNEVTIKHVDPAVPGHNNNASHPNNNENKNKLPQTGDKTEQNVLISLGVVAIATALGLAAFALRRKNK